MTITTTLTTTNAAMTAPCGTITPPHWPPAAGPGTILNVRGPHPVPMPAPGSADILSAPGPPTSSRPAGKDAPCRPWRVLWLPRPAVGHQHEGALPASDRVRERMIARVVMPTHVALITTTRTAKIPLP